MISQYKWSSNDVITASRDRKTATYAMLTVMCFGVTRRTAESFLPLGSLGARPRTCIAIVEDTRKHYTSAQIRRPAGTMLAISEQQFWQQQFCHIKREQEAQLPQRNSAAAAHMYLGWLNDLLMITLGGSVHRTRQNRRGSIIFYT